MSIQKVKVCGLREPENIREVAELPVDLLGFIFYPGSPRFVGQIPVIPPKENGKERVGVFVNAGIAEILGKAYRYELDYLQLHGEESPDYCRELKSVYPEIKLIKAVGVQVGTDFSTLEAYIPFIDLFLFDTKAASRGGTGRAFNWALLERYDLPKPFLLAGGIGPDSLAALKDFSHPRLAGVDLNSRFEIRPGLKDVRLLEEFLHQFTAASPVRDAAQQE